MTCHADFLTGAVSTRRVALPRSRRRAMGAASLLARAGRTDVSVLDGGPQDWADATGGCLEVGT
jgi:rhodanese-related sulfurtransferase